MSARSTLCLILLSVALNTSAAFSQSIPLREIYFLMQMHEGAPVVEELPGKTIQALTNTQSGFSDGEGKNNPRGKLTYCGNAIVQRFRYCTFTLK